jgi:hypothetical protein
VTTFGIIILTVVVLTVFVYGVRLMRQHIELTDTRLQQAQVDLWSSRLFLNEREIDLLERACSGAIHIVNKRTETQNKINNDIDSLDKKKMAMEIAAKFSSNWGVSSYAQELTDEMIEAILGSQIMECDDDGHGSGPGED